MKKLILTLLILFCIKVTFSQPSFVDYQKNFPRFYAAIKQKEDSLKKQFKDAGLQWPAKQIYIRSFKFDSQLEVWARNSSKESFKLFKTYKVCAMAGTFGPKRMEGDYQVPEGFYYINEFNPKSAYHLSLGINYPNVSDNILSDSQKPGNEIYIHGSCITVGCIPIQNNQIEELYILSAYARNQGQDFIPVHIFPYKFNNQKSKEAFEKSTKDNDDIQVFANQLKRIYDFFEDRKKLPIISINKKGEYLIL